MTSTAADSATFCFSTSDLPERDRVAACEHFGRNVLGLDIEPLSEEPFHAEFTLHALPALHIATNVMSASRLARTTELVRDGNDDLFLVRSVGVASQESREITLRDGDAVLARASDIGTFVSPLTTTCRSLHIPRALLAPRLTNVDDAVMRPIRRDTEALRLLIGYVALLQREQALMIPELRHLAATHVHDLVALAIGATRDAAAIAEGRGLRAARLHAIKTDIVENLGRHDLSVAAVAPRHGITPRYVQMLFETEGTTFSEFLRGQRLARAHRLLGDPRRAGHTISAIAVEAGFGDLSYFNRAFRRHYGATPSDIREQARRQGMA